MAKRQATSKERRDDAASAASHRPFAKLAKTSRRAAAATAAPAAAGVTPSAGAAIAPPAGAESERLRFAQLMRGVRPLEPAAAERAAADLDTTARQRLEALVADGVRFEVFDDGDSLEGRRLDVDPREIRKLRQLRYAVDGTIDLHGLTAAEARVKVEAFLRRRRLQGDRAVVIVHGKGVHSPRGIAILRGELAAWLSQGKAQRDVAAFASVTDRLGGTGSVCVLLAR